MNPRSCCLLTLAILAVATPAASAPTSPPPPKAIVLVPIDSESHLKEAPNVVALRQDVAEHPDDRVKRVALIRGLVLTKDLDGALAEAKSWRAKDAYNLVAVRALGDVHMERGEKEQAERVYSAIVELLPRDTDAQRSLATLLKQRGDLTGAETRLRAAVESRPEDARILFELADVEQRLGKKAPATEHLGKVIETKETSEQIRYPAKLRLAQLLGEERRTAKAKGDAAADASLTSKIDALGLKGGLENDIHVYLTWDTDRTDVDLWVTTPTGEKVFYGYRTGRHGEALYDDVTSGYGPESFTAQNATAGDYVVQVNYFAGRRGAFPEARGELIVVLDEGRPTERKQVLPYRLFAEKDTVTVARITVGVGGAR
jgi:tetratricopeptide (TPR) repeat protein